MVPDRARRPLHFIASSLTDLGGVPVVVRGAFGRQLLDARYGDTPASAKPLKGSECLGNRAPCDGQRALVVRVIMGTSPLMSMRRQ